MHSFVPHIIPRIDRIHSLDKSTSPFDDLLGGIFGKGDKDKETEDDDVSLSSFQQELTKRQQNKEEIVSPPSTTNPENEDEEFSGYDLRDIIFYKYGECFDVQFQRVDSYGVRAVYLVSLDCILCTCILMTVFVQDFNFVYFIPEHNAI